MRTLRLFAVAGCASTLAGFFAGCHHAASPAPSPPPVPLSAAQTASAAPLQHPTNADMAHYFDVLKVTDALKQAEPLAIQLPVDSESVQRIKDARGILATAATDFDQADHPAQSQAMDQEVRDGLAHENAAFDAAQAALETSSTEQNQALRQKASAEFTAAHTAFESVVEEIHRQSQQ